MEIQRRTFIRSLCYACGAITFVPACTTRLKRWRYLIEEEADLIEAVAEQFIPSDKDPGATEACVVNFFDKQLTGYYTHHQETYREGLKSIQRSAAKAYGKSFREMTRNEQNTFLEQMEIGELPGEFWEHTDQRVFFNMMLDHTMQAFYGSPRHGGNCNYVSYKMLKIDYPHIIGQNRYGEQKSSVKPKNKVL